MLAIIDFLLSVLMVVAAVAVIMPMLMFMFMLMPMLMPVAMALVSMVMIMLVIMLMIIVTMAPTLTSHAATLLAVSMRMTVSRVQYFDHNQVKDNGQNSSIKHDCAFNFRRFLNSFYSFNA